MLKFNVRKFTETGIISTILTHWFSVTPPELYLTSSDPLTSPFPAPATECDSRAVLLKYNIAWFTWLVNCDSLCSDNNYYNAYYHTDDDANYHTRCDQLI